MPKGKALLKITKIIKYFVPLGLKIINFVVFVALLIKASKLTNKYDHKF
jgi:hypothetical protein